MGAQQTIRRDDRYLELVAACPLRPIRGEEQHARALAVIGELMDQAEISPEEDDYIDVLAGLIERYEGEKFPLPRVTDAEILRHLLEAKGVSQSEAAAGVGIAKSTISEILSGQRRMNRDHIEALAGFFRVSPSVFMQPE